MLNLASLRIYAVIPIGLGLLALGGCGKVESPAPAPQAAAATPTPAPKPVTPNSFDDVTAQLDPGGDLYLYLSAAQWLGALSREIDSLHDLLLSGSAGPAIQDPVKADNIFALVKDIVQKSGLEDISGIGASSFGIAPGLYRNKIFIHHYADKSSGLLWSLYGTTPHDLTGLHFLPVDTAAAGFGDFDLAQLVRFLRQEADQSGIPRLKQSVDQWQTQFSGVSGLQFDDVLASFNGSMGLVLTLDATSTVSIPVANQPRTIPAPRLALLIAVRNDLVFKQVDRMVGGLPNVIKVDDPDLRMRTMPIPALPGVDLRVSIAQWNGFLVIASDDKIVRDMIAAEKGGPGYTATAEYATLSAGLPEQGNSFGLCTQRFADTLSQFQGQMFSNQPGANPRQAALMHQFFSSFQNPGHTLAVRICLPNGILCVAQSSKGASQVLAPLVVLPAAIGAAVAIPAFSRAHHPAAQQQIPPPTSPSNF